MTLSVPTYRLPSRLSFVPGTRSQETGSVKSEVFFADCWKLAKNGGQKMAAALVLIPDRPNFVHALSGFYGWTPPGRGDSKFVAAGPEKEF